MPIKENYPTNQPAKKSLSDRKLCFFCQRWWRSKLFGLGFNSFVCDGCWISQKRYIKPCLDQQTIKDIERGKRY